MKDAAAIGAAAAPFPAAATARGFTQARAPGRRARKPHSSAQSQGGQADHVGRQPGDFRIR
jgi:hypothetical protein